MVRCCLATAVFSGPAIPALSHYITLSLVTTIKSKAKCQCHVAILLFYIKKANLHNFKRSVTVYHFGTLY
jgi:hypothetical protein